MENVTVNLTKALRKESKSILDDQTMWVEKQQEFLSLVKDKQDVDIDIKKKHQNILILTGKKRKLDGKFLHLIHVCTR